MSLTRSRMRSVQLKIALTPPLLEVIAIFRLHGKKPQLKEAEKDNLKS